MFSDDKNILFPKLRYSIEESEYAQYLTFVHPIKITIYDANESNIQFWYTRTFERYGFDIKADLTDNKRHVSWCSIYNLSYDNLVFEISFEVYLCKPQHVMDHQNKVSLKKFINNISDINLTLNNDIFEPCCAVLSI